MHMYTITMPTHHGPDQMSLACGCRKATAPSGPSSFFRPVQNSFKLRNNPGAQAPAHSFTARGAAEAPAPEPRTPDGASTSARCDAALELLRRGQVGALAAVHSKSISAHLAQQGHAAATR